MADLTAPEVSVDSGSSIPSFADVAPEASARLAATDARRASLADEESRISAREGDTFAERTAGLAQPRADLHAAVSRGVPDMPRMEPIPDAPEGPIIDKEKFQKFGSMAFPFVLLLGAAMRADGVQALNALSSSVQGYMQGRQEESKHQFEQFKAKMDAVTTKNQQKVAEYRALLARRDLDMQQKVQLLEIASQKYDDAATYHATQRKSIADIYKHLDKEDAATMKIAKESVDISKLYEQETTKREHYQRIDANAKERIQKMGTNKSDAQTQKKLQWLQGQQINLYKTFAMKMSALTAKAMAEAPRKLAEQQLRNWFAGAMQSTNQIARAEGFHVPPETEAMENPATDPLGPVSTPSSEAENKSWYDGILNSFQQMFGHTPGANPSAPPAQGPSNNDGWSATPK